MGGESLMQRIPPDARSERRAALLADLARSINASLDLDDLVAIVAEGARELCASDLAAVALRDETGTMVFRHRAGWRRHERAGVVVPGRGAGGIVLETGRPLRSDDVPHDPRFDGDDASLAAVAAEGIMTLLVVPIRIEGRIEGLLGVDNRTARPFDDADEEIL